MAEVSGPRTLVTAIASGNLNLADPTNYRFVLLTGKDVHLCSASGQMAYGVLNNKPQDNEHASVCILGNTKISVGASLGVGAPVMTNNAGWAVLVASGGSTLGRMITGADSGLVGEMQFVFTGSGR
jgi:hypothetical protein